MIRTTSDSAISVEAARRRLGLTQADLSAALGITQGHYSKVVKGRVPLSPALEERIRDWLAQGMQPLTVDASAYRMRELAASIRMQCTEFMHLADRALAGG